MALSRQSLTLLAAMTALIATFCIMLMIYMGASFQTGLLFTLLITGISALLAGASYAYRDYLQARSFAGKKQAQSTQTAHQTRTIEIDMPFDATFALALTALNTLDNQKMPVPDDAFVRMNSPFSHRQQLRTLEANPTTGKIRAGLRKKLFGLTEISDFSRLDVQLERVDAATTRIHIESQPGNMLELYDLGKNLHYVNELALFLRRESQQQNAESRLSDADNAQNADAYILNKTQKREK